MDGARHGEAAEPLIFRSSNDDDERGNVALRDLDDQGRLVSSFEAEDEADHDYADTQDPFRPFDDLPNEQRGILTLRAVVVGLFCGLLVGASNIYLGLKAGWTSSANIFGSIIGFALLKPCASTFPHIFFLANEFGPRENNIVQTVATAAGGMSNVFTSAMPALYQLGLLSSTPSADYWRLTTLTLAGGYFGLFFATPLRSIFVVRLARELGLVFPSCSATASAIRSLHLAVGGTSIARDRLWSLLVAFAFAVGHRVVSEFAIGILWDWHVFTWLVNIFGPWDLFVQAESWGWFIEWTPAFIGSGMLVGLNVAFSFLAGTVLAWGIIGPIVTATGLAYGTQASSDPVWANLMSYSSLSQKDASADQPSPRYWLLWPGVLCMMSVSLTELLCQWRMFYLAGKVLWRKLSPRFQMRSAARTQGPAGDPRDKHDASNMDSALPDQQIQPWFWLGGLGGTTVLSALVMKIQFGVPVLETLLALFLSFFFSLLAVQTSGATDVTPLTAASKASQVVLGSVTSSEGWPLQDAQRLNLLGGALSSIGASQASDLVGDFRVGFLLHTSPWIQWNAQAIGTLFAALFTPALFVLFSNAYACINDAEAPACAFQTPSASAWRAVAVAVTDPSFPVPTSAARFAVGFAMVGSVSTWIRRRGLTGRRAWLQAYWPDFMIMALAFAIPATQYATAMVVGAVAAQAWRRARPASYEKHNSTFAAGLIAGEGMGGLCSAILAIAGVSGSVYGAVVGCPAGAC